MRERAEYMREYQLRWLAARRAKAVALLGGKCSWCDSTENLEIDHIYPRSKDPAIKGFGFPFHWSWVRIEVELAKCWLLCNRCHRVKTRDDRPELLHGTPGMWGRRRCRCEECRAYATASKRAWRAKNIGS